MRAERYKLPSLPDGQRWMVTESLGGILHVRLQEKRWWGWRTIASAVEYSSGGVAAVATCVHHILHRDEYARLRRVFEEQKRRERAQIPWGESR